MAHYITCTCLPLKGQLETTSALSGRAAYTSPDSSIASNRVAGGERVETYRNTNQTVPPVPNDSAHCLKPNKNNAA